MKYSIDIKGKKSKENMGKYEVVKDFFKKTQQAQTIKETADKYDHIEI